MTVTPEQLAADTPSPLEAAARAIHAEYGHPDTVGYWPCSLCLTRARVALLAAIEAIPEGMRIESGGVYYATIAKPGLGVLFGLGDQP